MTAIDVPTALLAERDEKGGPNTKDRGHRPMTMESMAAWIEVNRSRKAGWQVKVPIRNPDGHRLRAESHSAARGIVNGIVPLIRKPSLLDPLVRHG